MEPEVSFPHSQVPATCPYPEPSRSSPYPTCHFLKIHLNIILPSTSVSPKAVSFPQVSSPKPCICLSSPPYTLHAPSIYCGRWNDAQRGHNRQTASAVNGMPSSALSFLSHFNSRRRLMSCSACFVLLCLTLVY